MADYFVENTNLHKSWLTLGSFIGGTAIRLGNFVKYHENTDLLAALGGVYCGYVFTRPNVSSIDNRSSGVSKIFKGLISAYMALELFMIADNSIRYSLYKSAEDLLNLRLDSVDFFCNFLLLSGLYFSGAVTRPPEEEGIDNLRTIEDIS